MTRDLEILWQLQELDAELRAVHDKLARLPERRARIRATLDAARATLAAAEARGKDAALAKRKAEQDAEALAEQERKFQLQLSQVKKNEEYTALLHEIEGTKKKRSDLETFVLERMEEEGQVAQALAAAQRASGEAEAQAKADGGAVDAEESALRGEEAGVTARRDALLAELPGGVRSRYQRIHTAKRGQAVAEVVNGACDACGETLPAQLAIEVRRGDKVIDCPACGRMLLHRPTGEGAPA